MVKDYRNTKARAIKSILDKNHNVQNRYVGMMNKISPKYAKYNDATWLERGRTVSMGYLQNHVYACSYIPNSNLSIKQQSIMLCHKGSQLHYWFDWANIHDKCLVIHVNFVIWMGRNILIKNLHLPCIFVIWCAMFEADGCIISTHAWISTLITTKLLLCALIIY